MSTQIHKKTTKINIPSMNLMHTIIELEFQDLKKKTFLLCEFIEILYVTTITSSVLT